MTNQFSIQQVKIYILTFGGRSKFFFWFIGTIKQNDTNQLSLFNRYMTQIQMTQFVMICCHAIHSIVNRKCQWPLVFGILEAFQSIFFFFLFYGFYRASFREQQKKAKILTDANNNLIEQQKKAE